MRTEMMTDDRPWQHNERRRLRVRDEPTDRQVRFLRSLLAEAGEDPDRVCQAMAGDGRWTRQEVSKAIDRAKAGPDRPPSGKQVEFLRALWASQSVDGATGESRLREAGAWTVRGVSAEIERLKVSGPRAGSPGDPGEGTVPAGRYAVANDDGVLRFYVVSRPSEGKWAGRVFVDVLASDERHPVRGRAAAGVLARIAVDARGAAVRFGREIGRCSRCGRVLTDGESRSRGLGPDCRAVLGW